jgi:DNA processing protein
MKINKIIKKHKHYPSYLLEIASQPKELYYIGEPPQNYLPAVTLVGARKITTYGKDITYRLAYDLAKQGITIVSGLALGVDGIAHQGALDAGGRTIAVLAGGLDEITPPSHRNLAIEILKKHGTIMSEYMPGTPSLKQHFIARNRIVSALSDMVIITESAEAGGSLATANFALEQNKLVGAVPGNVTSSQSIGTNNLIKSGAIPITSAQDVLDALGLHASEKAREEVFGDTKEEQLIIDIMKQGITELDQIQIKSELEPSIFSQTITMLEISDKIRPLGAAHWTLK